MNLKGLKINFLGDSITAGSGTSNVLEKPFHQLIKKEYGLAAARNYGIGGSRIADMLIPNEPCGVPFISDLYFGLRVPVMREDADAVVVFGGTNDFGHGDAPLGTPSDTGSKTFCGAVKTLIADLRKRYPGKPVIFMTPIKRTAPSEIDGRNLEDYANIIKDICKAYAVPVIDLYNELALDPSDAVLVPDGLHPSDKGHEVMAEFIAQKLLEI